MRKIFLSYRRQDSAGFAGRISDRVNRRFGPESVFRDVEAIEGGADFVEAINSAVGSCRAFILVIGPRWLNAVNENGGRRLDDPQDFVRLEIMTALARNVRVIPALVEGAKMPSTNDLPPEIAAIAHRQAVEFADARFEYDADRLIRAVESAVGENESPAAPPPVAAPAPPRPSTPIPIRLGWSYASVALCPPVGPLAVRESNKCAAALASGDLTTARAASEAARKWNVLALAGSVPFWFVSFAVLGLYTCSQVFK